MEFLGHMVSVCLIFKQSTKGISKALVPFYIPTDSSSPWTGVQSIFLMLTQSNKCELVSHHSFNLDFFLCVCWPFLYFLRNVYLNILPSFDCSICLIIELEDFFIYSTCTICLMYVLHTHIQIFLPLSGSLCFLKAIFWKGEVLNFDVSICCLPQFVLCVNKTSLP